MDCGCVGECFYLRNYRVMGQHVCSIYSQMAQEKVCVRECVYVCNVCSICRERQKREKRARHEQLVVNREDGSSLYCFRTFL